MLRCQDTTHRLLRVPGSRVIVECSSFGGSMIKIANRGEVRHYDYDCGGLLGLASAVEPTYDYDPLRRPVSGIL